MPRISLAHTGFAALMALAVGGTAHAQTLGQRQMIERQNAALAEELPGLNAACGTTLSATIDWVGFLTAQLGNNSVSGYCGEPLSTLRSMCSDPLAKTAIMSKLKAYTCVYGGPGKRALALQDGRLTMTIDFDAANVADFVTEWIKNNL